MAERSIQVETILRAGVVSDAETLRALGEAVVPGTYGPLDPAYAAMMLREWWAVERLEESLARIPHVVVEREGQVIGVANLGSRDGRRVMWKLYVHPDHQGQGLGSQLLDAVLELVEGDDLWLEHVDGNDTAAAFYRARGFVEVERAPMAPYPDDVWMVRRSR